ncbi:MAG: GNAT family N-acetyltransferase [Acidobacteria bacterium]|nr:GNAT family N-acetyltransferase [Acidobacteriota bacterium]
MRRLAIEGDPETFRARVDPFLRAREAENNLLFGILHAIQAGRHPEWFLSLLERAGEIEAVAIMTPPHNLALSMARDDAARDLADRIHETGLAPPGVSGPANEARIFAERWVERGGGSFARTMAQRIYRLTAVRPPGGVAGSLRPASRGDLDLLTEWLIAFAGEAGIPGPQHDPAWARDRAEWSLRGDREGLALWETRGVPVSLAGFSGPTPNGIRVGPVYTPPARRRRGYASACVAALSASLLESGFRFCFLYTDLANPTSNAIYQRIGYEPVCDADMYRFEGSAGG